MTRSAFWLFAAAIVLVAGPLGAQQSVGLGIFAGYYRLLGHFDRSGIMVVGAPNEPSDLSGLALGVDAQVVLRDRVAVEVAGSTVANMMSGCTCPGGSLIEAKVARVNTGVLLAQYDLSANRAGHHLWLGAGPALVQYGGPAYSGLGSPRSWGVALGLAATTADAAALQLVAAATAVAYQLNAPAAFEHGSQLDVSLRVGLRWHHGLGTVAKD